MTLMWTLAPPKIYIPSMPSIQVALYCIHPDINEQLGRVCSTSVFTGSETALIYSRVCDVTLPCRYIAVFLIGEVWRVCGEYRLFPRFD